ncbi:hypothetical protein ABID96_002535 [Bacillus sp. OAE603]
MILACIVIGILGGIYIMSFEKVNRGIIAFLQVVH